MWLKPLLASLHARIEKNATQSSKFRLEKVFSYVLNQRGALSYYSEVDLAETDNNHTERDLRAVWTVLHRKRISTMFWEFYQTDSPTGLINSVIALIHQYCIRLTRTNYLLLMWLRATVGYLCSKIRRVNRWYFMSINQRKRSGRSDTVKKHHDSYMEIVAGNLTSLNRPSIVRFPALDYRQFQLSAPDKWVPAYTKIHR